MRSLVRTFLLLDALLVLVVGVSTFHGEHGWDFLLVNGVRLAVMAVILLLWRASTARWLDGVLFGKRPSQD